MDFLMAVAGLVLLLVAGDLLVRGAVNLSLRLGVPALIVSLTVVAFGTSAPELLVSVSAIVDGVPGLALGNVIGSNTANILLVLGIPAMITTLHVIDNSTRASYLQMLAATVLFILLALRGEFDWIAGVTLLAALAAMLGHAVYEARCHRAAVKEAASLACEPSEVEGADPDMPWWKVITFLILGLIGLPIGAQLLVDASTNIARAYGVSETVIGLTLVALGTSLPELATTVMAALRKQADVAFGNVIGSNMFNLLGIIGISSLIGKIPVDVEIMKFDIWVMLSVSVLLGIFVLRRIDITRIWGIVLSALYVLYVLAVLN
ncbi:MULTISPECIES: calcium/sodium antiporter [Roseobacteraceae]|jgi:cation:H+ antiporter|uniref:Na+/Ca+ antiporter n=1 Tax=Celeribacter baekdonensis B30 TaxID=1208323 RepID=K2J6Q7_9RHOB|nr:MULTISPECIES: calcium/sodium antiporter [Roseobacteraceae]EKE70698.1 Na+/Ca+ antiporter [Celeribacter baekdonensis B30]KAB6715912.1 sodium:calcium antiporter [Roseobacter sp. TSBP12]|tara:strand:- start:4254 stop:5213 length:960 start_codon:yes stop_codon:yes gene_type:complete